MALLSGKCRSNGNDHLSNFKEFMWTVGPKCRPFNCALEILLLTYFIIIMIIVGIRCIEECYTIFTCWIAVDNCSDLKLNIAGFSVDYYGSCANFVDKMTASCNACHCCVLQHLKRQQEGLSHLISIVKDDLEDLRTIEHGLVDAGKLRQK